MASTTDRISTFAASAGASLKSIVKILLTRRRGPDITAQQRLKPLIILGNGPSLRQTIDNHTPALLSHPTMAVNFAANTPEFFTLKPEFYVLADPHFTNTSDPNVASLISAINRADWPLTLLLPYGMNLPGLSNPRVTVMRFPAVGVEGARSLRSFAIRRRLGMPRPRNVMVCAIMCGIWLGFTDIFITGADHSWTRTLSVDSSNRVVTIQPHYYKESESEEERVASVYTDIRLHQILESFSIAFRAYHDIADFTSRNGINVYNASPGSFIDAFPRRQLPES